MKKYQSALQTFKVRAGCAHFVGRALLPVWHATGRSARPTLVAAKSRVAIGVILVMLSFAAAPRAYATDPVGDTYIVKRDGRWIAPKGDASGDFIIVDKDENRRQAVRLEDIFPGKDYQRNVVETLGAPKWGINAISFVTHMEGVDYFYMRCASGKKLLINLDTGDVGWPAERGAAIEAEQKRIVDTLRTGARALANGENIGSAEEIHGAIRAAVDFKMTEVREYLEAIEKHAWRPGRVGTFGNEAYEKGLNAELLDNKTYRIRDVRRSAQLALRRLGFTPLGYPVYDLDVRDEDEQDAPVASEERRKRLSLVKRGMTSQKVYQQVGSPDYIESAFELDNRAPDASADTKWSEAWRYDFAGTADFSAILIWNEQGRVERMEQATPGLWRGDELFSEEASKPVFRADGNISGLRLYTREFQGRINVVRSGAELTQPLPPAVACVEEKDPLRLDLKMEHKDGKALLHVTVVNVGEEPIVVDRKLEFGIWIHVLDEQGDHAPHGLVPQEPPSDRPWTVGQWNERMVKLRTGQSATRVLDLYGGYDIYGESFEYGIIYSRERVQSEMLDRQGRQIQFIDAHYFVTRSTLRGLKQYFRVEPNVSIEELTRTSAMRFLDVKTGKMFDPAEMCIILDELERQKRRKSDSQ